MDDDAACTIGWYLVVAYYYSNYTNIIYDRMNDQTTTYGAKDRCCLVQWIRI